MTKQIVTDNCGLSSVREVTARWSHEARAFAKRGAIFGLRGALFAFLALGALFSNAARGQQTTADVVGTVTDTSGAVVPGASVTIINTATNISQTTVTDASGDYIFNLLQAGTYQVKVEAKGFKSSLTPNLTLAAGDRTRVNASMAVGDVSQTVEVSAAAAPALQTDTSSLGTLVTSQGVEDLPLNGRNLIKLVQLSAGVTAGLPGSLATGSGPDDRRQTSAFSVNGQVDSQNNNLIDGVDNNERVIGLIGVRPSIDAIQEVNVSTNLYEASVGRTAGGVVNVITKSGTNDFHGTAYEFFRNKVLNANPNYDFSGSVVPNPPFQQNQYGGSIGGPIRKNKTFFFADMERFKQVQGTLQSFYTVPTMCERGLITCPDGLKQVGDFSDNQAISPLGGGACPTAGCAPPPNIPAGSIDKLGLEYFNMYPLPTCGPGTSRVCSTGAAGISNNFASSPTRPQTSTTIDGRIDQHFSDKDTLFGRYSINNVVTLIPEGFPPVRIDPTTGNAVTSGGVLINPGPAAIGFPGTTSERQQNLALSYVHVFQPNLLVNMTFSYLRSKIISLGVNAGTNPATALGYPCNAVTCVNTGLLAISGLPTTGCWYCGAPGPSILGDTPCVPELVYDNTFQYSGALTWNKNSHSIKVGLGLIRRRPSIAQNCGGTGNFNITGTYTGSILGDMLEGLALGDSRSTPLVGPSFRTWEPSVYLQDDWRARRWLTLNLGVRYDIFTPYTEVHGRISNYDPLIGLLASPSIPGLQQSGPTALVPTLYTDLAPRFGFAATLAHHMVVRGGFGLSFFPTNYQSQYTLKNAPFNYSASCSAVAPFSTPTPCGAGTGAFSNPVFANGRTAQYGNTAGQIGGAKLDGGLPPPVLDITLATNPANYAGQGITSVPPSLKEAYVEQFNLQVQKDLWGNVVTLGYVGELGRHLAVVSSGANENQYANSAEQAGGVHPVALGDGTLAAPQFPWLNGTTISEAGNLGTSSYEGLQATLVRRFKGGLTVNFNYAWSHTLDNTDGASLGASACIDSLFYKSTPCFVDNGHGVVRDEYGWQQYSWGNAAQDVPNRFAWAIDYQLPFGRTLTGVEGVLGKGWEANTSGYWQTGIPYTVSQSDPNEYSTPLSGIVGVVGLPNQIGSGRVSSPNINNAFNVNDFKPEVQNTLGDEENNQMHGLHQREMDFSIFKDFTLTEKVRLQFRTEVFNLLNTPNFGNPNATLFFSSTGSVLTTGPFANTGHITSLTTGSNPRQIQFALKVIF